MITIACGRLALSERKEKPVPVSSSRFVLPFAYLPVAVDESESRPEIEYRPADDPGQASRRTYPTLDTAHVLFRRAGWFELETARRELFPRFEVQRRKWGSGGSFGACIESVKLVLFEWRHERERALASPGAERRGGAGDLLATGFLLVDVSFEETDGPVYLDDLLAFNEHFRYFKRPFSAHETERKYAEVLADLPVDPEDPEKRLRGCVDGDANSHCYQGRWATLLAFTLRDETGERWHLFPKAARPAGEPEGACAEEDPRGDWQASALAWLAEGELGNGGGWSIYADTRAFVSTAAMVHGGLHALDRQRAGAAISAARCGHWIRLLNVDNPASTYRGSRKSTAFERRWAAERTYTRWEEHGTVYGFTYHSAAVLGPAGFWLGIDRHWRGIYFDQTLLLLYLRVTTFRFSRELSRISGDSRTLGDEPTAEETERWRREFQRLRTDFALFTNLYEFPLVSNQQQGVELYALAREHMDVSELFAEVRQEVHGTHQLFDALAAREANVQAQRANDEMERLTRIAGLLGLGALVTGFLGMNILIDPIEEIYPFGSVFLWSLGILLVVTLLGLLVKRWIERYPEHFPELKSLAKPPEGDEP